MKTDPCGFLPRNDLFGDALRPRAKGRGESCARPMGWEAGDHRRPLADRPATATAPRPRRGRPRDRRRGGGFFTRIGLIGEDPELEWMEAVDRFAVDDLEEAIFESNDVIGLIYNAADIGQMRVLWASSGFAGLLLVGGGGAWLVIRLRHRRRMAIVSGSIDPATSDLDLGSGQAIPGLTSGSSPAQVRMMSRMMMTISVPTPIYMFFPF